MFAASDIKHRLKQQPFRPFRMVSSSGQAYEIRHPDLLLVGVDEVSVGTPGKKDPTAYERLARVALADVTAIEDLPAEVTDS